MVTAPPQLVWQLIKRNNCFIVNGLHGKKFSSEPGNLYNLHSYKHSGAHARSARTPRLRAACSRGSAAACRAATSDAAQACAVPLGGAQHLAVERASQCLTRVGGGAAAGLANDKVVHIGGGGDEGGIKVTKSRPKLGHKPASAKHTTHTKHKNFRRTAANVGKVVGGFRPDLKVRWQCCAWQCAWQACTARSSKCTHTLVCVWEKAWILRRCVALGAGSRTGARWCCAQEPAPQDGVVRQASAEVLMSLLWSLSVTIIYIVRDCEVAV